MSARRARPQGRAPRSWWSVAAALAVLGLGAVLPARAAAQQDAPSGGGATISVERVDATGDVVVADGSVIGADPARISVTSGSATLDPRSVEVVGDGLANDVVVVIDNTGSLGNATVQLAKQAVDALLPGEGVVDTLGVVSTGGAATVDVGPTSSDAQVRAGLEGIRPTGATSATWEALSRAAALLAEGAADRVGTVVLFSAAPEAPDLAAMARARSAIQQAGLRLDVVAMSKGTAVAELGDMVATVGGTVQVIDSDEQLAGAFDTVAAGLAGRFRASFAAPPAAEGLVPLEVSVGDASAGLAYAVGGVRAGSTALAPIADGGGGGGFLTSSLVKWLIVLLGVVAAVMRVLGVGAIILSGENSLTKRLEVYDESFGVDAALEEDESSNVSVPIIKRAVEFTGDMAERRGVLDKVESKLERANLPLRAAEAMFFTFALAAVSVALVYFLTGSPVIALAVAVLGALLPLGVLDFKIRSRQKAFVQQLPDMLGLLAGTLKAGYSIGQGFEAVSGEIDDPMGRELRRVMTETRLGRSLEESLEGVAERMDSDDFAWAVMAIRIQREGGGNLAELLMTVADTMTQRERLRREVSTLTAEGKMSAIIIGALPPVLCMVMFLMNPDYIGELFTPGLGYGLIAGAVLMLVIGFAWMKKTITIEV